MSLNILIAAILLIFNVQVNAETTKAKPVVAEDQGRNASDTELTRSIREKIVADHTLSMRAKNITIVSQKGKVTLKGSVATAQEQTRVEEIARGTTGTQGVNNQTEVSKY